MLRKFFISLVCIVSFLGGFGIASQAKKRSKKQERFPKADLATQVSINNLFAFDVYSELKDLDDSKNVFYSPYSITTALGMLYEGAGSHTAEEIQSVFRFIEDPEIRRDSVAAVHQALNKKRSRFQLSSANSLWAEQTYPFLKEYTSTLKTFYKGRATNVDFVNEPDAARIRINNWVEKNTNNKIKDLFGEGTIHDATRMVLVNAVYFKGKWKNKFIKKDTQDRDFTLQNGTKISVPLMNQEARFNYFENESLQAVEMIYKGKELSMLVLLPTETSNIAELEANLNLENFIIWRTALVPETVNLALPRFTFMTKYDKLSDTLSDMGMPSAFIAPKPDNLDIAANLSLMDGERNLYVETIVHQAFVAVDEQGTEAAAATGGVVSGPTSVPPPPKIFHADRPFIFIIQERKTGNILFLGKVLDPSLEV